ncbi:hypothetical protein DFH11DRAFT_913291 [Phellopilus nigrolimitatus]|nr:hypothetical protein DFH11DRAFT_913291 [Phellopilus nigrolimitatus]
MSFDVSEVSDDVWIEIALFCSLKEVLCLESTCKFLRNVFMSDRIVWLRHLHMLEQNEAPDLPRHIPISTLTSLKLRGLVIDAHRRHFNCTNPDQTQWLQHTREISVSTRFLEPDMYSWGRPELLPGGTLFLAVCMPVENSSTSWFSEFLQCFSVSTGECIWTYQPDRLEVRRFDYDMQENGDVHVLTESGSPQMGNIGTR